MTEIIRVFRGIRVERMNTAWYKLNMNIYLNEETALDFYKKFIKAWCIRFRAGFG